MQLHRMSGFDGRRRPSNLEPASFSTAILDTHRRIKKRGKSASASCPNYPDRTRKSHSLTPAINEIHAASMVSAMESYIYQ